MELAVVVIGGGAAGALAGLAARRAGARVTVVARSSGATAVSSGAFDFGTARDHRGRLLPLSEAVVAIAYAQPFHPYARLGDSLVPLVSEARRFLCDELRALGVRGAADGEQALRIVTQVGTIRRTTLAQGAIARGDVSAIPAGVRIGVVGIENVGAFDPSLIAAGLREAGFDAVPVFARLAMDPRNSVPDLARLVDGDGRGAFVAKVAAACHGAGARFAFLPTAGLRDSEGVCDDLVAAGLTGAAEISGMLPSLPGLRLQRALDARLDEAGVERLQADVESVEFQPSATRSAGARGTVRSVRLVGGRSHSADAVVLASGRFISGGIVHDGRFVEPLAGLPVYVDGSLPGDTWVGDLLDRRPEAPQPALRAGVRVDERMRPVDEANAPVAENLFAVGSVIGGYELAQDTTGLGVAAVTAIGAARHCTSLAACGGGV